MYELPSVVLFPIILYPLFAVSIAVVTSGAAIWQRSLQVTRMSAVVMPGSIDSRQFPRMNAAITAPGLGIESKTPNTSTTGGKPNPLEAVAPGVGVAEGQGVRVPVVTEYVIERYGYPFSKFKMERVTASTSECFKRTKDGTFTPKYLVPADIKRAEKTPVWERGK